jgi:hypothetical protein
MKVRKYNIFFRLGTSLFFTSLSYVLSAQTDDSLSTRINDFTGAVTVQSKGISTIPNLTLGKPAAVFDMKLGRKLTFEPQFRFALDGKPWAMVFWWRYYATISNKFKITLHTNYSFSYKSINSYTSSGVTQEIIRTTRYLVGAIAPSYQVNSYAGIGMYFFYNRGIEKFITRNTLMVSFRPVTNIPFGKNMNVRISPEIYHLTLDDNNGLFFNASFSMSRKNFPLSVSGLINKPIKSDIPSEYDFLWNVGLSYTFNKQYIEKRKS